MESQLSVSHVEWDRTTPQSADLHPQHRNLPSRNDPPMKSLGPAGLTASAPVSDVSAPACTNGLSPSLRPVSVAQKNKQSTMFSSNVQCIDLPMDCMAWRFWTMRQSKGCSTPARDFARPISGFNNSFIRAIIRRNEIWYVDHHVVKGSITCRNTFIHPSGPDMNWNVLWSFRHDGYPTTKSHILSKYQIATHRQRCHHSLQQDKDFTNEVMVAQDNVICLCPAASVKIVTGNGVLQ